MGVLQLPAPVVVARPPTIGCCLVPCHPYAGDQFALLEAVTAAAMIVRRFDFERAPDKPPGAGVAVPLVQHRCAWPRAAARLPGAHAFAWTACPPSCSAPSLPPQSA